MLGLALHPAIKRHPTTHWGCVREGPAGNSGTCPLQRQWRPCEKEQQGTAPYLSQGDVSGSLVGTLNYYSTQQ